MDFHWSQPLEQWNGLFTSSVYRLNKEKKKGKTVKGLDLEENIHEGHGFDSLDPCFASAYA